MVRSPEAATSVDTDGDLPRLSMVHHEMLCISAKQMTDNIFEIETTAVAHVACSPQESGILFCFGDDSHRRDARHSRHRED